VQKIRLNASVFYTEVVNLPAEGRHEFSKHKGSDGVVGFFAEITLKAVVKDSINRKTYNCHDKDKVKTIAAGCKVHEDKKKYSKGQKWKPFEQSLFGVVIEIKKNRAEKK